LTFDLLSAFNALDDPAISGSWPRRCCCCCCCCWLDWACDNWLRII